MTRTASSPIRSMLLLPVAALAAACGSGAVAAPTATAPAPPVGQAWLLPDQVSTRLTLAEAREREVGGVLPASGRVSFDDLRVTHVFSPVTGRITRILAQPGQRVRRGQALCVLQSPDVGSAYSDVAKAEADRIAAEHDYRRKRELYAAHAAAQTDFEAAEDNVRKARAEEQRARQKAKLLSRGSVDRVTQEFKLVAPIDGEVIARAANPGLEVQGQYTGGTAPELFTIGELDRVWVVADVFEMDLSRVRIGQPVSVKVVAFPDRFFRGVVEYIASALDPVSRVARVRCSIDNTGGALRPEMYATVSLETGGQRAIAVPRSALLRVGEAMSVFVRRGTSPDGRVVFERVPVELGGSPEEGDGDSEVVAIRRGLTAGQTVVIRGAIELLGMI